MKMTYPEKIRFARFVLKEKQDEFAKRFEMSKSSVSLWEAGKREAPYKVLMFVEDILSKSKHLVDNE